MQQMADAKAETNIKLITDLFNGEYVPAQVVAKLKPVLPELKFTMLLSGELVQTQEERKK